MVHLVQESNTHRIGSRRKSIDRRDLRERAERASSVAGRAADDVDRAARFPAEAVAALRTERLLGVLAPIELGGEEADVRDVIEVSYRLGRACSATALIYAMHQTMVACLVRFGAANAWQQSMLSRIAREQLLIASSTTEGARGGDVRSSEAPVEWIDSQIRLTREVSCISYGEQADCILTVARRAPDAASTQQVLTLFSKEQYALEKRQAWDTLGMRGTCSAGYRLTAEGTADQVLSEPFDRINAQCMMPVAHLAWSGAWMGIASAALDRARASVRQTMRRSPGKAPGLVLLTHSGAELETLRARIARGAEQFIAAQSDPQLLEGVEFQATINLLKVEASEAAFRIALAALRICGLSGYRNDTAASVGRHVRDLASAPLMISNDRILANMGAHALISESPETIGFW